MFIKRGVCKHYRDSVLMGVPCRKGIPVLDRCDSLGAAIDERPCHRRGQGCFSCEFYAEPTAQELEEQARQFLEAMENAMRVRRALAAATSQPGPGGEIVCPICSGTLRWTRDVHGEIAARCENEGCVTFPFSENDDAPLRRDLLTEQRIGRKPPRLTK